MSSIKFIHNGKEYPFLLESEKGYDRQLVIIPEVTGDYFLSEIDSLGNYNLIETLSNDQVLIKTDPKNES